MAILKSLGSKVPIQANNGISSIQSQQGGKEAIKHLLALRHGLGQEMHREGRGGA
jgi:hypothetical protein